MIDDRDDILTDLKIIIIGNAGVGKSCLLLRFVEDRFDESLPSTIGVDYKMKTISVYDRSVRLQLWDTAGLDRYQTLTPSYYRGAQGIVLVYDVTDRESFVELDKWLDEALRYCEKKDIVSMLVGNKIDIADRRVTREEGSKYAHRNGMLFIETSAKTRVRVHDAFEELVVKMIDTPSLWQKSHGFAMEEKSQTASSCYC